jgi:hypothetical protein
MRPLIGPRTAEEIIGASLGVVGGVLGALVFGIPRDRWEGIQLRVPT